MDIADPLTRHVEGRHGRTHREAAEDGRAFERAETIRRVTGRTLKRWNQVLTKHKITWILRKNGTDPVNSMRGIKWILQSPPRPGK